MGRSVAMNTMMTLSRAACLLTAIAFAPCSIAAPALQVAIPTIPAPVLSDRSTSLAFEVVATNTDAAPVELIDVTVLGPDGRTSLERFNGSELSKRVSIKGGKDSRTISAG